MFFCFVSGAFLRYKCIEFVIGNSFSIDDCLFIIDLYPHIINEICKNNSNIAVFFISLIDTCDIHFNFPYKHTCIQTYFKAVNELLLIIKTNFSVAINLNCIAVKLKEIVLNNFVPHIPTISYN